MKGKYFYNRNLVFKEKFLSLDFTLIFLILLLGIVSFFAIYSTERGNFGYFTENHIYRFFTFFVVFIVISFVIQLGFGMTRAHQKKAGHACAALMIFFLVPVVFVGLLVWAAK